MSKSELREAAQRALDEMVRANGLSLGECGVGCVDLRVITDLRAALTATTNEAADQASASVVGWNVATLVAELRHLYVLKARVRAGEHPTFPLNAEQAQANIDADFRESLDALAALAAQPVQAQGEAITGGVPSDRDGVPTRWLAWIKGWEKNFGVTMSDRAFAALLAATAPPAPAVDSGLSEAQTLRVKSMIVGMTLNVSAEARAKFADELLNLLGLPR